MAGAQLLHSHRSRPIYTTTLLRISASCFAASGNPDLLRSSRSTSLVRRLVCRWCVSSFPALKLGPLFTCTRDVALLAVVPLNCWRSLIPYQMKRSKRRRHRVTEVKEADAEQENQWSRQ